jgi:hypothetical protein
MTLLILAAVFLCIAAQPAIADRPADVRQWKPSLKSMFMLVQGGYKIAAMTEYQGTKNGARNYSYILQKDVDVYKCLEFTVTDPTSKYNSTTQSCWHLVGIFSFDPNDKNYLEH